MRNNFFIPILLSFLLTSCSSDARKTTFHPQSRINVGDDWTFIIHDYSFDESDHQIIIFETFVESRKTDLYDLSQFTFSLSIKKDLFTTHSFDVDQDAFYTLNGYRFNEHKPYFEICYIPYKIQKIAIKESFSKYAEMKLTQPFTNNYRIIVFEHLRFNVHDFNK